jgi:glycosyltransferase involved in cell wall biosynthesis
MIQNGETGWLYSPGDTGELTAALRHVLAMPERGRATGLLASVEARKQYSLPSVLEQTDRVLSGISSL